MKISFSGPLWNDNLQGVYGVQQIDGLVQERRNSSALAKELRLSCTSPSKWTLKHGRL